MLFVSLSSGFSPLPFEEGKFVEGFACLCNFVVKKASLWKGLCNFVVKKANLWNVLRVCVIL